METTNIERRRFDRHPVTCGLVFSDNDHLVGMAQVVDMSQCGIRCVGLSTIDCTICILENIELFGSYEDLCLTEVGGEITRCNTTLQDSSSPSGTEGCEFAFEFFPQYFEQVSKLEKFILSRQDHVKV